MSDPEYGRATGISGSIDGVPFTLKRGERKVVETPGGDVEVTADDRWVSARRITTILPRPWWMPLWLYLRWRERFLRYDGEAK